MNTNIILCYLTFVYNSHVILLCYAIIIYYKKYLVIYLSVKTVYLFLKKKKNKKKNSSSTVQAFYLIPFSSQISPFSRSLKIAYTKSIFIEDRY